ncbi:MAG TPA: BamA/TamA family outer membrane protein [Sphingomicrobium sp.]|nr:BamA/TamA family outer membrane protein [Sphingomicrobium sp.]
MDAMPDLGVEWPDLNVKDAAEEAPEPATGATRPTTETARVDEAGGERRYVVDVDGLEGVGDTEKLLAAFRKQSALEENRRRPANTAQIDRRSRADSELLAELLRSEGFYDATVEPRIEAAGDVLRVVLDAEPGQQYRFATVELPGLDAAGPEAARLRETFAIKPGDPVIAEEVIAAGIALRTALGEQGYASARIGEQDVDIDHSTHLASLTLPVDPGPVARFGSITVSGEPPFSARHIWTIARFDPGDPYQRSKIDDLRRALIATSLVSSAEVQVVPVDGGRTVNLAVRLEPAPSHTIAGEVGYGTGQGPRVEASWTDRNFFNPEGALTLRGVAGTSEQLAAVQVRRSNFMRRDQVLNLQALASHREFSAYEARTAQLAAYLERQSNFIWQKTWTWTFGAELLATDERGVFGSGGLKDTRTFLIAATPVSLGYDGSDNLLDPTTGFRLSGRVSPEISARGGSFTYARTQFDASAYKPVSDRVVAAGRIRLGTIVGAGVFQIAPSRRFYSGGGGSVRGYGYQQLGPKDMDGDPVGGRGLAEFALEARIRLKQFGGNFGIVPFFDGGSLTEKSLPDFGDWRFAVGLGARYYSSFGPIRIDLGVPLNRRKGDGPVAVTVSLGQAF